MESANGQHENDLGSTTRGVSAHFLNLPPSPRYETAAGQSTRMIIDSASYNTTPSHSPRLGPCHDNCPTDSHHKVPDVATLAAAGHVLSQQMNQAELGYFLASGLVPPSAGLPVQHSFVSNDDNHEKQESSATNHGNTRGRLNRGGIIPSYMLQALASSEAAGSHARASAQQTLASASTSTAGRSSSKGRHRPSPSRGDLAPSAPRQRQLENGTWLVGV